MRNGGVQELNILSSDRLDNYYELLKGTIDYLPQDVREPAEVKSIIKFDYRSTWISNYKYFL